MDVLLRPQVPEDRELLTGGESPYDDFGPQARSSTPPPCDLDGRGALTVMAGGEVAGEVSWHWEQWGPNAGSRCPMIGIWLRPEHRGRGVGTVAQRQLVELFFRYTRAHRVEAHTDVENAAEQQALHAAGFQREGVTRGAQWRSGAFHDGVLYAVLRSDPRPGS